MYIPTYPMHPTRYLRPSRYDCGKYCNACLAVCVVLFAAMQRKHEPVWKPVGGVSWGAAGMGVFYALKVIASRRSELSKNESVVQQLRVLCPQLCAPPPLARTPPGCALIVSDLPPPIHASPGRVRSLSLSLLAAKGREAPHEVTKKDD